MAVLSRGFGGRRAPTDHQLPPGQYETRDFPVLSAGPTPQISVDRWEFTLTTETGRRLTWTWPELMALPQQSATVDIHCVTKWSKFDTAWTGVSVDTLLEAVDPGGDYLTAWCDGGYTTNLALEDVTDGRAWVVHTFGGEPLEAEHGGPVRLLVPHLYLWKSAKWVRGLALTIEDEPGFWEAAGYHNRGDPWHEQRYWGD